MYGRDRSFLPSPEVLLRYMNIAIVMPINTARNNTSQANATCSSVLEKAPGQLLVLPLLLLPPRLGAMLNVD